VNEDFLEVFDEEEDAAEVMPQRELYEHYRFVVDKGQTLVRIDKYLVNCMSGISRNRIQEAADAGNIHVNEKSVKSNYRIKPFDVITIHLEYPPTEFEIYPQDIPIDIVYEDEDIILMAHCSMPLPGI
jgi:23S rRNA pseudouridine1911/1915/1917 synthase